MKNLKLFFFSSILMLGLFSGCINQVKNNTPAVTPDTETTSELCAISVSMIDGSRTALPDIVWNDYEYTLKAIWGYGTASAQTFMVGSGVKAPFSKYDGTTTYIIAGHYQFTLIGYDGENQVIIGQTEVDIADGHQNVPFRMYPAEGVPGSAEITLIAPDDGMIKKALVGLTDDITDLPADADCTTLTLDKTGDGKVQAVFAADNLASAADHFAYIKFFDADDNLITSRLESIIIVGTQKTVSKSTIELTNEDYLKAKYRVNYWRETLSNSETPQYVCEKYEIRVGNVGELTNVSSLAEAGFTIANIQQKEIESDSSTVIDVKYNRNTVKVTLDPKGGFWTADRTNTYTQEFEGKYGASFTYGTVGRNDYVFAGWSPAVPSTFPASNLVCEAQWNYVGAKYKVEYYFEKDNSENFTGEDKYELKGTPVEITSYTGATTQAEPLTTGTDGYTLVPIVQGTVASDSSTVVKVYYDRNEITYTFIGNQGTWSDGAVQKEVTGLYKAAVTAPSTTTLTREDYSFAGWNETVPATFGLVNRSFTANWTKVNDYYTIKYLYQNIGDDEYTENESERIVTKATIGSTIPVTAAAKTGFKPASYSSTTALEEGGTTVEVKYDRDDFTLTFNPDGGNWDGSTANLERTGRYGAAVLAVANPVKANYDFAGWTVDDVEAEIPSTIPAENITYKAKWVQSNAKYNVTYKFKKVGENEYVEVASLVANKTDLPGLAGETTAVTAPAVTGFTAKAITQKTLVAGSPVTVEVLYDRNLVTITYDKNGGTWVDAAKSSVTKEYGDTLTAPTKDDVTLEDYELSSWLPAVPSTVPAENATYKAQWTQKYATYQIDYYKQAVDGTKVYDTTDSAATNKGLIGATTTVTASDIAGFTTNITQATIIADGSAKVEVYYTRKTYSYTFNLNGTGSSWENDSEFTGTASGLYGAPVTIPTPVRTGYKFMGWNSVNGAKPDTFGSVADGTEYKAVWQSELSGAGINPINTELGLTYSSGQLALTVPTDVATTWTFKWVVDGQLRSETTQTLSISFTKGKHYVTAIAVDSDGTEFSITKMYEIN